MKPSRRSIIATVTIALRTAIIIMPKSSMLAQSDTRFQYEIASIRPNRFQGGSRLGTTPGGRLEALNVPISELIRFAYDLRDTELIGIPERLDSEYFDIIAKTDGADSLDTHRQCMKTLLKERFKLAVKREKKIEPAYVMTLGSKGLKIPASPPDQQSERVVSSRTADVSEFSGRITMERLAGLITGIVGRRVVDQTKVQGLYTFKLLWSPDHANRDPSSLPAAPSIFVAVQEQLGLKLSAQKVPIDILVVEHVERPSEN